ncbi:MAG: pilus assembly protein [Acidobacteriia bacterium]|nr:pilus assembly protein [Terriglobia bacterium]
MKVTLHRRGQRGNAMIEATLTLSLFLTIIFSIYDFGWVLFFHQTLVHQARTGARYAAVNPADLAGAKNLVLYNQTSTGSAGLFGLQPANVSVTRNGTAGAIDDSITVTISGYQYTLITLGWAGAYNGKTISVSIPVEN